MQYLEQQPLAASTGLAIANAAAAEFLSGLVARGGGFRAAMTGAIAGAVTVGIGPGGSALGDAGAVGKALMHGGGFKTGMISGLIGSAGGSLGKALNMSKAGNFLFSATMGGAAA